jgi:predicted  nucleic acid-binding Zn-ribbon protein
LNSAKLTGKLCIFMENKMITAEMRESKAKIQSLEAENKELIEKIKEINEWYEEEFDKREKLEKENAELRSKLEVAVEALRNWITWEDEQVRKDGAYVRPEINELIKNGKQALETIMAQDD